MHIFRNRPLALSACVMAATAVLALRAEAGHKLYLIAALLSVGLLLILISVFRKRCAACCATAILCLATASCALAGSYLFFNLESERFLCRTDESVPVEGIVLERDSGTVNGSRFVVRLTEFDGAHSGARILLECNFLSAMQDGDCFRLYARVRDFQDDTEFYHEEAALRSEGIVAAMVCEDSNGYTVTGERQNSLALCLRRINRGLSETLRSVIGGEEGALGCALLLGNRSFLGSETVLDFRRSGVSHLLALSGLHISILIGIVTFFLSRLRIPKPVRIALIPPIAVFYLILTGGAVSTLRAVLMTCVLAFAFLSSERYDSFTALCSALMVILTATPYAVLDASFWLSFSAAAAIIVFLPALQPLFSTAFFTKILLKPLSCLLRGILVAVATGLFANSGILAISVAFTGSASPFSVPVTLLLSPAVTAALFLCLLVLAIPAAPVAYVARIPLHAMLFLTERTAQSGQALIVPTETGEWVLLWLSLALTVLAAVLPLRHKATVMLPVLVSLCFLAVGASGICRPDQTKVDYLHGTEWEIFLVTEKHGSVAIDISDGRSAASYALTVALRENGCAELDDLILTHYHSGTAAMLAKLSGSVRVRRLRLPVPVTDDERAIAARLEQEARLHRMEVLYDCGDLAVGTLEILWMEHHVGSGVEASVSLSFSVGDETFTALSAQLPGSDEWQRLWHLLPDTDTLILLSHGRSAGNGQTIRLPARVKRILYADVETAGLCPVTEPPPEILIGEESCRFIIG